MEIKTDIGRPGSRSGETPVRESIAIRVHPTQGPFWTPNFSDRTGVSADLDAAARNRGAEN